MKNFLVLIVLFSTGCTSHLGEGWTKADTYRQLTFTGLHIVDTLQTAEAIKNPDKYKELNPILGDHPDEQTLYLYSAAMLATYTLIPLALKPKPTKWWQNTLIGLKAISVGNNYFVLKGEF